MKQKTEKPQHRNFKMMLRNHMINQSPKLYYLEEMGKLLNTSNLSRLNHEEIKTPKRSVNKEIELVIPTKKRSGANGFTSN